MPTPSERIKGYLKLMRPAEWTKSFGNMIIAAVFAAYAFSVSIPITEFVLGMISVVLLWSGLYTLNDVLDWHEDARHRVKKKRPIPAGHVSPQGGLAFSYFLLFVSLGIAMLLQNALFFLCLVIMFVNQMMYSSEPFSLKKKCPWDLISGSVINPVFRFYAGWVLLVPAFNAPLLALAFVIGLQFGGYGLYRLISAEHDKKLGYASSVVRFKEKKLRSVFYLAIALAGISYFLICLNALYFPWLAKYGSLPVKYLWLAIGSIALFPLYWKPMKKPGKADMESVYRILYVHYLFFIFGFWVLYYFV